MLPLDRGNLVWRAAVLLAERAGVQPAVRLDVVKGIPVAGGLAGGSADAAATLVACDALWGTGMDRADLLELAAELGSDVAFSLTGGTALGTGRGERLTPVLATGRWHWVFAIAGDGLSTPRVYGELDRIRSAGRAAAAAGEPDRLINALRTHDPAALGRLLANDLQAPALALRPELRRTLRVGLDLGALGAVVSGSGPTCAFLARSREAAVRLAAALAGAGVCRTVRVAYGPVSGARVVATETAVARERSRRAGGGARSSATSDGGLVTTGVPLVSLEAVGKAYATTVVLDRVSLGVSAGERIGVVGRNGGGKTTLLRLLAGLEEPDDGRVASAGGLRVGYVDQRSEPPGRHRPRRGAVRLRPDPRVGRRRGGPRRCWTGSGLPRIGLDAATDRAVRRRAPPGRAGRRPGRPRPTC